MKHFFHSTFGSIAYRQVGVRDQRLCALFLHGLGGSGTWWPDDAISTDLNAVVPDLIGFGESERAGDDTDYSFDMQAEALAQLLDALDVERVIVIAHSMASAIVHPLSLRTQLAGLVLVEGNLLSEDAKWSTEIASMNFAAFGNWFERFLRVAKYAVAAQLASQPSAELSSQIASTFRQADPRAVYETGTSLSRLTESGVILSDVRQLAVPTIYLRGDTERAWPGHSVLPPLGIEIKEIRGAGHYLMIDNPIETRLAIQTLTAQVAA